MLAGGVRYPLDPVCLIDWLLDLVPKLKPSHRDGAEDQLRGLAQAWRWRQFNGACRQQLERLRRKIIHEAGVDTWRG